MTHVQYTGAANTRQLSAADFKKLGVDDQGKMEFSRMEPVEVSSAVAEALLNNELVGGNFEEVSGKQAEAVPDDEDLDETPDSSTAQTGTENVAPAPTRAGTSTGKGRGTRASTSSA